MSHSLISRRLFLQMSALTMAGSALAACAVPVAPQSTTGGEAAPAGELIEMGYFTADRELENNVKARLMEKFNGQMEADGKPYRVVDVRGPATDNDIKTKLTLDAAAGTLPDIIGSFREELIADFLAANYLLDMTSYVTKWDDWKQYYPILQQLASYDGKVLGVPTGGTFSFFYRKDLLEQNGIPVDQPKTWDDFYTVCGAIADKTQAKPCGLPAATPWGGGTWSEGFIMVWLSFDGPIFEDGKWVVSSPNLLNAFKVYETLASNGWLTVDELLTPNPWEPIKYQGFPDGTVGIVTGGDWQWTFDWGPEGATPIEGLFEKVERWAFPAEDGKPFTYVDGGVTTVVAATAKSADGANEFLWYGQLPDVQCELMEIHIGGPSARMDMADVCPFYKEAVNGKMLQASEFFETGRTYNFEQIGAAKLSDGVGRATEDIITGTMTAEEAMNAFADAMTDALGEDMVKRV